MTTTALTPPAPGLAELLAEADRVQRSLAGQLGDGHAIVQTVRRAINRADASELRRLLAFTERHYPVEATA